MPTAEDMAEYILTTGDQQTVAQLIIKLYVINLPNNDSLFSPYTIDNVKHLDDVNMDY